MNQSVFCRWERVNIRFKKIFMNIQSRSYVLTIYIVEVCCSGCENKEAVHTAYIIIDLHNYTGTIQVVVKLPYYAFPDGTNLESINFEDF